MYRNTESELGTALLLGQAAALTAAVREYLVGVELGTSKGEFSLSAIRLRQATRLFAYLSRASNIPVEAMLVSLDQAVSRAHDPDAWYLQDRPEDYFAAYDAAAAWTVRWALREFQRDD